MIQPSTFKDVQLDMILLLQFHEGKGQKLLTVYRNER